MGMRRKSEEYGGFVVSKRVLGGVPVGYSYREESGIPAFNGWTLYSVEDDEAYGYDPRNFTVVGAETLKKFAGELLEIFEAPYGTELGWRYEKGKFAGFYDLVEERPVTAKEILRKK